MLRALHSSGRAGLAAVACLACAVAAAQTPPITLHYQERPPYSQTAPDGQVQGLLVVPAERAFARAQLPYRWMRTPSQRQLALIQGEASLECGIGWFRNPERESLGRFSLPLYQDRPFMALVRRDAHWTGQRTPADLLTDPATPLLVKDGYSYGPLLDGLIAQHPAGVRRTSAESTQMARMVQAGRAAWMIIAPEEADALLAELGTAAPQLQLVTLAGVPPGQPRHLYCNRAVPDSVIERLNRALSER